MKPPNLLLDYDVYERHAVAGRLLRGRLVSEAASPRVLDVGGRVGLLDRFLDSEVVSVNPDGTAQLVATGGALPFADRSFDAVVTIDTLEHLPRSERPGLLEECLRVAASCVVVAAPLGSAGHTACEERLDELHRTVLGAPHPYLAEHVRYGLPGLGELEELTGRLEACGVERFFAGDYRWQGRQFERAVLSRRRPRWLRRWLQLRDRLTSMALFRPIRLRRRPAPTSNRFYLLISRADNSPRRSRSESSRSSNAARS